MTRSVPWRTLAGDAKTRFTVKIVVALCILVLMLEGTDAQLLAFAAPVLLKEWGLHKVDLANVLAAAFAGMILGSAIGGILGDKWGRRRIILVSIASFGGLTAFTGAVTDLQEMTALRFLGGIGFGAVFPNIFALVSEFAPLHLRSRYVAVTTTGVPLGSMVGALVVGWAMPLVGWRTCFFGAGVVTLASAGLLAAFLPESPAFLDKRGLQKAAVAPDQPRTMSAYYLRLAVSLAARAASSLSTLFRPSYRRRTFGLWLLAFTLGYVTYAFVHWGPTILVMSGISLRMAIMSTFFISLFMAIAPFAMAWGLTRFGSRTSMLAAIAIYVLATAMFGVLLQWHLGLSSAARIVTVMLNLSVIGFAIGATSSCLHALSVHSYPISCRATGSGLSTAVGRLGAVATAIGSAVILGASGGGPVGVMFVAIVGLAIAAAGTILIDSHIIPIQRQSTSAKKLLID